jgi:hypothetical protein
MRNAKYPQVVIDLVFHNEKRDSLIKRLFNWYGL